MKKVLFFLLAIIFAIQGYGQSTFVVANGTATNSYLPVYGTWMDANQHNQFIYPASMLGPLPNATISKLTFHATSATSSWGTATCIVKIGVPTETNFASATYNTTTLTQVYSGPIAVANSVLEFVLTTPYLFSGGNLLIDITTTTSGSFLGVSFNGITTSNGGVYQYGTGSPTLQQFIPKMSVEFTGGTPLVETSAATSVFATSAIFNGNFFAITPVTAGFQYMDATLTDWASATVVNATTLTAPMTETVSALTPNTQYKYRAFANNGTTFYYGEEKTFMTLALPAYLPYACDFENPTENAEWTFINGTQTNKFYIGDASFNPAINNTVGGSNALYISNDTGTTWAYSAGSGNNSWVYAYRDFEVPAGVNELKLDFDWIANGGVAASEFLRVYWMPTSIPITAGAIPPTIASVNYDLTAMIGNYTNGYGSHWLSRQTTWQHATFTINTTQFPTLAGSTWRLYVHWRNNQTTAVQPPATFDNMTLVVSNCPTPRIDSTNNMTQNSVDIHFTENGSANSWNFQYRILGTTTWTDAQGSLNPYTLPSLQPSTSYEVRMQSDCSSEQSAWSPIRKFNTSCGTITQIPWADYFDNYGTGTTIFPACWTRKANVADRPYISSTNFSSPGSMYFNCASSGIYNNASTPMIDAAYPINTLMLNFRSYFSGSDDTLYVGTMTDPIDSTTFTEIAKFSSTATATWINQVLYLNSYTGTDQYITFRTKYGASSSTIYIDNLQILPMPTCLIPNTLSSSNITAFDATINWLPGDISQSTWWIYYKPVASTTWDSVQVFAYPHTLTNLIPSTNYQFYMRTDCGSELSAATNVRTFMTQCVPVSTLPWNEGFEGLTAPTTLPPCWAATSFGSKTNTQIVNYGSSNRNARTGTAAAYFVYSCNDRFFTPGMQLTAGVAYKFSYWFVTDGIAGWTTLQSGVYAAQTAGSLIQTMNTINGPTNGTYQEVVSYFTPTTDGVYYFGIYCQAEYAPNYLTIDDISLDLAPACLPVQQLAVTNIVGTSAYASWLPAGTPDSYTVELSETGSGVWTTFSTTTPNFVLTNLTELTDYSVQVYPMCSGVEGPRDTVDFTTVCAAGGDLIIGTPNATTSTNGQYLLFYDLYDYAYTQQIFDATELANVDSIFSISFQYFKTTPLTRNIEIYLGHTLQTTYTGVTNFIPSTSFQQVFQGSVTFSNSGPNNWFTISFPSGFEYHSDSNLVVTFRNMTGIWETSDEKFRTHATTGTKAIYFYQDDTPISISSPSAVYSGTSTFRNNIKFSLPCLPATCIQPNVILSSIGIYNADMIIVPGASETSWEAEYKKITDTTWTSLGTVSSTTYSLPGLSSNTTYQVRFRAVCSVSDMSAWKTVTFTTDCGTIEVLPFVENFDSYTANSSNIPTCWTKLTTNGSYPYIYGYNSSSTPNSLYFYTSATTYAMIVLPPVDQTIPLNTLQLTFWGRNNSAGQNLKIGVMTDPYDATTFSLIGTFTPVNASTYEEYIVSFANYTDTGVYIAIKSDNIAQSLSNDFYIDNLSLDLIPSCSKPLDIVFSTITTTEATASWNASPTALSYEVVYGLPGVDPATATPISVTDTFIDMTTLTANTLYHFYVRSVCAGGEFSDWTFLRTFRTACDVISTIPYTENFDTYGTTAGVFPSCWFRPVLNTTTPWPSIVTGSTYVVSSPASLKFQSAAADQPTYAISPQFNVDINTLRVTFKLKAESITSSGTMQVGVMSDPNNLSTFELVETITPTSTNFTTYEVMFTNTLLSGTGKYIAFRHITVSSIWFYWLDDVVVDLAPTCLKPTQIVSSNITTSSANITWTPGYSTDNAWWIYYKTSAATVYDSVYVTTNPYVLPGLTPATTYQLYMKTDCGTQLSDPSNTISFTTACLPIATVPYIEYFDTYTTGTTIYPTCWSKLTSNATYPYISSTNFSGPGSLYIYSGTAGGYCHAITPMFDATIPINTLKAEFKLRVSATDDTLYVGVMTDPTDLSTFVLVQKLIPSAITTWQNMEVFFNTYNGTGQYIAFKNVYTTTTTTIYVDNLEIFTIPTCPRPTNLIANNSTSSSTTLSWTPGGTETSWNIEYGPIGFTPGSGTSIQASSNPFTLNGLTHSTCYDFYVQAVCSPTDLSMWSHKGSFCTAQIPVNVPFNIDFETASGVQIANNATGNRWFIGTDTANTVNNTLGGQNALYVSNDNGQTNAYTLTTAGVVWAYRDIYFTPSTADYTFSFDWRLVGETGTWDYLNVYIGNISAPVPSTTSTITPPVGSDTITTLLRQQPTFQTKTFTLPFATYSGQTKRIYFMWRNDGSDGTQPPAAVDNISITSTGITSCVPPSNVLVSNISANSATVTWTPGTTETEWELDYKLTSASTWTTIPVLSTPSTNLTTLLPTSDYDVRVRAKCDATTFSAYSPIVNFTTTNTPCDIPTNVLVPTATITDQSAVVTWTAAAGQTQWQVEYKLVSAVNWTTGTANTTSYPMTGLQSNADYVVRVKALCSPNESAFTANVPFTTLQGTVTYTITATAGPNGTITPSGAVTINQGASQTFTFTPNSGFIINAVAVNGTVQSPTLSSYTFPSVQSNGTIHVDFVSGISENELAQLVELFPNPTTSIIELRLKSDDLHVKECKVFDMYGKLMKTILINSETTSIDVTDFASGVYFVRMDSERGIISKKFVKK